MFKKPALLILAFIMLVNALAYGTIIPLLYPYAARFGLNPLGLSLLFASFSLAQFIATPVLGRLSDKLGRKPVLLGCLLGTAASLALFAMAKSLAILFIARMIDGITGGNISVAQAMIADSSSGEERAKSFGLLGAAFGVGFLVGPALGGLLSQFGITAPFWFAAVLATIGTLLGAVVLKETLPPEVRNSQKAKNEPLFRFDQLLHALFSPTVGIILLVSFLAAVAVNTFIIGFQSFTVDVLTLNATQVGLLFAIFGLVSTLMQMFGIKFLLQWFDSKKKILVGSFIGSVVSLLLVSQTRSLIPFGGFLLIHMVAGAPQSAMLTALLSERTSAEDQGGLLGINQSYVSLGQVVGPLIAGGVASTVSVPAVFIMAAALYALAVVVSRWLFIPVKQKADI